jgi:hypothetical protein
MVKANLAPCPRRALDPDAPAMSIDDALRDEQAESGPFRSTHGSRPAA